MEQKKFEVYGEMFIPIYFPIYDGSSQCALERVTALIGNKSISKLDGDLHLLDKRTYPIITPRVRIKWLEALSQDDL